MPHDRSCRVCRDGRRAVIDVGLVVALACTIALLGAAWWLGLSSPL